MPAPPIDNPTPYTCPNCGAGLQTLADFCPHCGARLEKKTAPSPGFVIGSIVLAILAPGFGAVGACSGLVTYSSFASPDAEFGQSLLVISLPLLAIGLAGMFVCGRAVYLRFRQ